MHALRCLSQPCRAMWLAEHACDLAQLPLRQLIYSNALLPREPIWDIHLATYTALTGLMLMNAVLDGPALFRELPRLPSLASLMLMQVGPSV